MTTLGLVGRVRSWFGTKAARREERTGPSADRWLLEPAGSNATLALVAASSVGGKQRLGTPDGPAPTPEQSSPEATSRGQAGPTSDEFLPPAPTPTDTPLDPLDPQWLRSLDRLPERIAESVAHSTQDAPSLERVTDELQGHKQTSRDILEAVRRLPEAASDQARLARETNRILEQQCRLSESMLDGITALRAAYRTVEETSKRQLVALGQLEASHREALVQYQSMLMKMHRRLGRLAALATVTAAAALAGAAYVAYLVLATS